ncbi:transpeptidase family protein [Candidatus Poribacteria bacterium]|nr:transpeptidase family protein [Candidatus Poribacteria bacterium]
MKQPKTRINIIFSSLVLFFFVIFYKLISLQVFEHIEPPEVHKILDPKRGRILDRNMQELAVGIDADSLYCAKEIDNPYKTAKDLSVILGVDFSVLNKKLRNIKDFTWIARKINYEQALAIKKLNNPYLEFQKESKRIYPNNELASHIIGFVGTDNDGLEGIELAYDSFMSGKPGMLLTERDAKGRVIISKNRKLVSSENGADVILTLDKIIQHIAEQELKKAYQEYKARGGSAIVMNPYTGEILALVSVPQFDPNEFNKYSAGTRRNRAISDTFEPGSTMKIFTSIAGLEEGVVTREEVLNCEKGSLKVGGHVVRDSHDHHKLTFQQVMEVSSNMGIVRVALRLGKERIYNYFKKFGFGEKVDLDLQGEVKGKLLTPDEWSGTSITAIPIGQEISVTSIQLARGISIVANGGYIVKPFIIKEINSANGKNLKKTIPEIGNKIISDHALEELHKILENVVEEGTGRRTKIDDYTVAAKTGTAQKFVRGHGGYASGETVMSFVGYAPVTNPKLAIVVVLESTDKAGWAEGVLGPVFKNIAQRSLHYLNVLPDKTAKEKPVIQEENERKITLAYNYPGKIMPSVLGMSVRKTIDVLSPMDMDVKVIGNGVAINQVPSPGTDIEKGGACIVYFAKK